MASILNEWLEKKSELYFSCDINYETNKTWYVKKYIMEEKAINNKYKITNSEECDTIHSNLRFNIFRYVKLKVPLHKKR